MARAGELAHARRRSAPGADRRAIGALPGTEVEFTRDPEECVHHAARDRRNLSLLLNATTVDQILAVARAGDRMPEKSTYFMPKVATGMVMYPLD